MKFHVVQPPGLSNAQSPFRVADESGREVAWVNRFLDRQRIRAVAETTLRSYAHDLLHFLRSDRRGSAGSSVRRGYLRAG